MNFGTLWRYTLVALLAAVVLAIAGGSIYLQAKLEADAYYRATGIRVQPADAMWLELRVQAQPQPVAADSTRRR